MTRYTPACRCGDIRYEVTGEPLGVRRYAAARARINVQGERSGFLKAAGPLLARQVKKNLKRDLETLKSRTESGADPESDTWAATKP